MFTRLDGGYSASSMRHWLRYAAKLRPTIPAHTSVAIELIGALSRLALRSALDHVVFRHAILRSVFRMVNGVLLSVVGPSDRGIASGIESYRSNRGVRSIPADCSWEPRSTRVVGKRRKPKISA